MTVLASLGQSAAQLFARVPIWLWATIALSLFCLWWNGPILAAISAAGMLIAARKFGW